MQRIYAKERPALKEDGRCVNPVTQTTLLNFDIREEIASPQGNFSYLQVELFPAQMNKSGIVNAIIRAKYDQADMEAIINNYLNDGRTEDFVEMQAWRKMAKDVAMEALECYD